jgi:hypothetical protein
MSHDGTFVFYVIQFRSDANVRWHDLDASTILFAGLSYAERRGPLGERYRSLLDPLNECWQRSGKRGYDRLPDARATLAALRERSSTDYDYRIVRRVISQITVKVEGTRADVDALTGSQPHEPA